MAMEEVNTWFRKTAEGHTEGDVKTFRDMVSGHDRFTPNGDDYAPVALHHVRNGEGLLFAQPRFPDMHHADIIMVSRMQAVDLVAKIQKWLDDTKANLS